MKCVNTGPQLNKLIDGSRNNVTVPNFPPRGQQFLQSSK